jgi:hypothetical protein
MAAPLDPGFRAFLAIDHRPTGALALALREIVLDEAPAAVEQIYRNHPHALWYGHGPKMADMVLYVAMASAHVNLGFCRGVSLPDPDGVLEGTGRSMRHIKFRRSADLERPFLRPYIRASFETAAGAASSG